MGNCIKSKTQLLIKSYQHRDRSMRATQVMILLWTVFQAIVSRGQLIDLEPEFLAPLENHTVTQGRDVFFTCVVNHLSTYKVAWIKSDTKAILAIHTHMVAQNPRLSVTHNGHNTWKLHVSNVKKNDSGTYMCQINTDPMRSQMGHLEVVIPPDILNDNESTEGAGVAIEGGTIKLRCSATGVPEPAVLWRREDSRNIVLRHENGREKQQILRSFDGEVLTLTNVQRTDMGAYLCIASNGIPPSVSKRFAVRVHFHPMIRVSNQLVAAPVTSDVLIQCYVEASPKAMNHWMRDNGEKLLPNDKYEMSESPLNEYSLLMNLTIKFLEKRDFGGYICTSSNALGKADGVVRLQELHLAVKTTSTTTPRYVETKPRKTPHKEKPKKYKAPRRKESDQTEEQPEFTTVMTPEIRTASPGDSSQTTVSKSPAWIHLLKNGSPPSTKYCCTFVIFVLITCYRSMCI
ncbi:lachesin-like [Coccinella septempunctata]|uniref:lachesin-like n=1 Tax=Coccinella septempunctata TaxID=41139 RepID=UPI001D097E54|nr:lachesin-like [Coccinella septempunctata]